MNPVVSILTPSFNRADLYPETLASLKAQTYPHWEVLHALVNRSQTLWGAELTADGIIVSTSTALREPGV